MRSSCWSYVRQICCYFFSIFCQITMNDHRQRGGLDEWILEQWQSSGIVMKKSFIEIVVLRVCVCYLTLLLNFLSLIFVFNVQIRKWLSTYFLYYFSFIVYQFQFKKFLSSMKKSTKLSHLMYKLLLGFA